MFSSRTFIEGLQQSARGVPRGQIDIKQSWSLKGAVARMGESWQLNVTQPMTRRKADKPPKILLGRQGRIAAQPSEVVPETHMCSWQNSLVTTKPEGSPADGCRGEELVWLTGRGEGDRCHPTALTPLVYFFFPCSCPRAASPAPTSRADVNAAPAAWGKGKWAAASHPKPAGAAEKLVWCSCQVDRLLLISVVIISSPLLHSSNSNIFFFF